MSKKLNKADQDSMDQLMELTNADKWLDYYKEINYNPYQAYPGELKPLVDAVIELGTSDFIEYSSKQLSDIQGLVSNFTEWLPPVIKIPVFGSVEVQHYRVFWQPGRAQRCLSLSDGTSELYEFADVWGGNPVLNMNDLDYPIIFNGLSATKLNRKNIKIVHNNQSYIFRMESHQKNKVYEVWLDMVTSPHLYWTATDFEKSIYNMDLYLKSFTEFANNLRQ
jgi:hypothetical protein